MADINFDEEIALIDQQVKNDIPVTNNTIAPPVPIKRKIQRKTNTKKKPVKKVIKKNEVKKSSFFELPNLEKNVSEEEPEEDGRDLFINNLSANMLTDIKTRPTDLELLQEPKVKQEPVNSRQSGFFGWIFS